MLATSDSSCLDRLNEFYLICAQARQKDATANEQRLGHEIALNLQEIIAPFFLRRTKDEVRVNERLLAASGGGSEKSAPL